jgi:hypothetical protein
MSRALAAVASVLLVGATLAGYARLAFFDSCQFADRASAALAQPAVRTAIGERVTDEIVLRNDADLVAARPLIASTVSGLVGGGTVVAAALEKLNPQLAADLDAGTRVVLLKRATSAASPATSCAPASD